MKSHHAQRARADREERGWLLQRRAATKALFAGRWANTCCTHPRSPALRLFLADLWAWLGGSREWHSATARYQAVARA